MNEVPVIDIGPLRSGAEGTEDVAASIDRACREVGFFCVSGHGAPLDVLASLDEEARRFFARPEEREGGDRDGPGRVRRGGAGSRWAAS